MVYGYPSKIISALDTIHDAYSISVFLDLLDGHRIEVYISLVSVEAVLVFEECVCIFIRNAKNILSVIAWDDLVSVLRVQVLEILQRSSSQFAYLLEVKHLVDM